MTGQGLLERRQERDALFAQGGEIASDATKHPRSCLLTETARDFLLDFDHANIAFGLVIIKGHSKILQESQDLLLMLGEPIQEIACRMLFVAPFLRQVGRIRRISQVARIFQSNHKRDATAQMCGNAAARTSYSAQSSGC